MRHAGSHFFFLLLGKKTFEKLSFFRNFASYLFLSALDIYCTYNARFYWCFFAEYSLFSRHTERDLFSF